jgi:hypothetical protein
VAVADPLLQRNPPGPARFERGGDGVRREPGSARFAGHGPGPVDRQPAAEIDEWLFQGAAQQQGSKAGTVDKQVAGHHAAIVELELVDATVGAAPDLDDAPFGAQRAPAERDAAQEARVQAGIEMVSVAIQIGVFLGRCGEAALVGHHAGQALLAQRAQCGVVDAAVLAPQTGGAGQVVEVAKGMEETVALGAPVAKLDAELERAIGGAQERGLVDAVQLVKVAQHRERGLAHADDADLFRFDQFDRAARQRRRQ